MKASSSSAEQLISKAIRAADSARLLLNAGDFSGACNREYYAMFDAAGAALQAVGAPAALDSTRSHSGLIHAFSMHVIKPEWLPKELGRQLTRAHELRLIADYKGDPIEKPDALAVVEQAKSFVAAVRLRMSSRPDPGSEAKPKS